MRVSKSADSTTIHIAGRFTFTRHREFKEALAQVSGSLIVDLSETQYVDSAALGLLLIARDAVGQITLSGAKDLVKETLAIASFNKIFTIV